MSSCSVGDLNNCSPDNILIKGTPTTKERVINTNLNKLPTCQMINYKPLVLPDPIQLNSCSRK